MKIVPEDLYVAEEEVDSLLEQLRDPKLDHITRDNLQNKIKEAYARVLELRKQYG